MVYDELIAQLRKVGHYASDGHASSDGTSRPRTFIPDRTCQWAAEAIENLCGELLAVHKCWDEDCAELFEIRRERRAGRRLLLEEPEPQP